MALMARVDQSAFDGLGDLKSHYAPVEGKEGVYQLVVDPANTGLALADVTGLQKALSSEREARKAEANKLKMFGSLDPAKALEAVEFKTRFDSGELDDESKVRLTNAEKALAEKFEAQRRQLTSALETERSNFSKRESTLMSELRQSKIDSGVRAALLEHGANSKLLGPHVASRVKLEEVDGKFVVQVLDDRGQPLLSRQPGSTTEPMTISEYVSILKEDKDFAVAFEGSGASGAGSGASNARGSSGGSTGGTIRLTESQAKDVRTYRAAEDRAKKEGRTLQIVPD